jgi:hypothetical protein
MDAEQGGDIRPRFPLIEHRGRFPALIFWQPARTPEMLAPALRQDIGEHLPRHRDLGQLESDVATPTQFQVETLEFLTNKEVSQRLGGASPGLAANEKVGFATLRGTFIVSGPLDANVARFSRVYAAFDAKTGNLLMIGTLEEEQVGPN